MLIAVYREVFLPIVNSIQFKFKNII